MSEAIDDKDMRAALADIAAERRRQIEVEGWTAEHDDQHDEGQMAAAAASYAMHSARFRDAASLGGNYRTAAPPPTWPWDLQWWKPKDPRRDLVRAAALIVAEIERLDRRKHRKETRATRIEEALREAHEWFAADPPQTETWGADEFAAWRRTRDMIEAALSHEGAPPARRHTDDMNDIVLLALARDEERARAEAAEARVARLTEALRFYANREHLLGEGWQEWESATGEPPNWLCPPTDRPETVEDGSIARAALAAARDGGRAKNDGTDAA